ncbi:transcription factor Opi1-domain-containing protein [Pilobolus umbonatus]|nr:transcription factor Opi1-domain-containing protein [Pilobolus umbonatus]
MVLLKNFLVSLATQSTTQTPSKQLIPPTYNTSSVLSSIKKDIVDTLRKVVEVITRYAGSSLPAQARQSVRGFILNLPGKWVTMNNLNDIRSTHTSPAASPLMGHRQSVSANNKQEAAIRLLSFGQESLDMLNSVSVVFSDTVDRAELWIDRLKMVPGINSSKDSNEESVRLPPIRTLNTPDHNLYDHHDKSKFDR